MPVFLWPFTFSGDPMDFKRNPYGWLPLNASLELLRIIFPNYPDISTCRPLPQWVKDQLEGK